ncbi:MAG: hypothetical protein JWR03_8 [Cohnella sp.]|jgi:hypothetical protein|nr:hypothetical protein [Cohnella sp.]
MFVLDYFLTLLSNYEKMIKNVLAVQKGIVRIKRPVDEVFHWIADYTKDRLWCAEVKEMKYITPDPIGVGSRCLEVSQVLGKRLVTRTEVTEYVTNEKVVCKS